MQVVLRQFMVLAAILTIFLIPTAGLSEEWNLEEKPWEKFGANFGVFISSLDSSFTFGSGLGLYLDVEDFLGLDATNSVFRLDGLWRFSKNRRHRLDFNWFSFRRDGDRRIGEDITIGEGDDQIIIEAGTNVEAFFDLDIYQLGYSYSFFQDDRIDLAAGFALYVMPIDFGLKATGLIDEEGSERFTAPLPALGLRLDIALTPKWFIRTGSQVFYLEYDNFTGSLLEFRAALEYNPWKHVGLGVGFDSFNVKLEADGSTDWPGVDLNGTVDFKYNGLQLYLRVFY